MTAVLEELEVAVEVELDRDSSVDDECEVEAWVVLVAALAEDADVACLGEKEA